MRQKQGTLRQPTLPQSTFDRLRKLHDNRAGRHRGKRSHAAVRNYIYHCKLSKGCSRCGERRPSCLQFHHLDPKVKTANISGWTRSLESLKTEIAKCEILCGNCHLAEENG